MNMRAPRCPPDSGRARAARRSRRESRAAVRRPLSNCETSRWHRPNRRAAYPVRPAPPPSRQPTTARWRPPRKWDGLWAAGITRPFGPETYPWRHLFENFFCKLKEFKQIALKSDHTDQSFAAMIYLSTGVLNSR